MKKIVKMVAFWGISGNSGGDGGGDGVLNSNHRGTGRGKMAGDLGERFSSGSPWHRMSRDNYCIKWKTRKQFNKTNK